ncbi:MAG: c-type cytochrome [Mariprofundales bacterium]|nr:c-type cytochrome [Mariprofundales bacterium]
MMIKQSLFAILAFLSTSMAAWAGDIPNGKDLFLANCAVCHGKDGAVSNYGRKLKPFPARNLRALVGLATRDELRRFIVYGVHDTAMTAKKYALDPLEIEAVIDYIKTFTYQPNLAAGKKRFEAVCSVCHGKDGRAQTGMGAKNLVYSSLNLREMVQTMRYGRSGTLMTSKRHQISNADIANIANYVYSLRYNADTAKGKRLYRKDCASCHATPSAIHLIGNAANRTTLADLDNRLLELRIRHGRHVNRAGRGIVNITPDDMQDIIAYMRSPLSRPMAANKPTGKHASEQVDLKRRAH